MIPVALAWLGVIASVLLVVLLPAANRRVLRRPEGLVLAGHLGRVVAAVGVRTDARGVAHRQRCRRAGAEASGVMLLPLHILAGGLALLFGYVALYAAKGATLHRKSGMLFVFAMVTLSLSGA